MTAFLGGPDERESIGKGSKKKMFRKLGKGRV
jgi:hypothetical protein